MKKYFWGLVIIIVGFILLGNNLNVWDIDIFFEGWWTLFIIVPSVLGLFKKEYVSSLLGIIIGVLLLLGTRNVIEWNMVGQIFFPILIIVVGISFMVKPHKKISKEGLPEYIGIFSGCEEKITEDFKGAECVSVFGGVDLDIRNCKIKEDIVINCVSVFGGIDLFLPSDVKVKISGTPIFGGVEYKSEQDVNSKSPTVYINYVCVFAGIDIK